MYLNFTIIRNLAVATTVLQFLSGIIVCKQYVKDKTTGEASPLPFICGIVSSILWLFYGIIKQDNNVVAVNVIGSILMFAYTNVFYIYTVKKKSFIKKILVMIVFISFVLAHIVTETDNKILLNNLGTLASVVTLLTIIAPMSKLLYVLKVKSTYCLPFPMIIMSFVVSLLWFMYGLLVVDVFMVIPNVIGSLFSGLQLSLFAIYPNTPPSLSNKSILA